MSRDYMLETRARVGNYLVASIGILLAFGIASSYYWAKGKTTRLKQNWPEVRCDPRVMPFAGMINAPDGVSARDYTASNAAECGVQAGKHVAADALKTTNYLTGAASEVYGSIGESIQSVRGVIDQTRTGVEDITKDITTRAFNMGLPLVHASQKTNAALKKTQAVLGTTLFGSLGAMESVPSFIGASETFLAAIAGIMFASSIPLWFMPWTIPAAIALDALGVATVVVLGLAITDLNPHLHVEDPILPSRPSHCFPPGTLVETPLGEKPICELRVGDRLGTSGARWVTATFHASSNNVQLWNIDGVLVSSTHKVWSRENGWTFAPQHPAARLAGPAPGPFLSCINTSDGEMQVGPLRCRDWDDLSPEELELVSDGHVGPRGLTPACLSGATLIELQGGERRRLTRVRVGDVLADGNKVAAVVDHGRQILQERVTPDGGLVTCTDSVRLDIDGRSVRASDLAVVGLPALARALHLSTTNERFWTVDGVRIRNYDAAVDDLLETAEVSAT
jgi:hypothetical protein